jgi:hypothetical protein
MKFGCDCGNVLKDQTDIIPYKARFIADQDHFDLIDELIAKIEQGLSEAKDNRQNTPTRKILRRVLYREMAPYLRTMYQCRNCGRIYIDDPDEPSMLQIFAPESEDWKKVFASVNGEDSKVWGRNLVGHWDSSEMKGSLWFDPPANEKGGYETFDDWESLQKRYYELFEQIRSAGQLQGARMGIGKAGESIRDVHNWSVNC